MRRQIPIGSQKRLLRLISARADLTHASEAFAYLSATSDEGLRYHLFLSMVVSYSRPFTENHGLGSLLCEYPGYPDSDDPEMNLRHTRLLAIRHNFLSHSSIQGVKAFLLSPGSQNPISNAVSPNYDYAVGRRVFLHPEYAPWLHQAIETLARRVDTDLATAVREIGSRYLEDRESRELDTGNEPFSWE